MPSDNWQRIKGKLEEAGVETWVHETSIYFTGPDGERLELLGEPLGQMYGTQIL
jgi:extradiol dioxygenase family protein